MAALSAILAPIRDVWFVKTGTPNTLFLIQATDGANNARIVPMMNAANWFSHVANSLPLDNWTKAARQSRMAVEYPREEQLSVAVADDIRRPGGSQLSAAFKNGGDAALATKWNEIATTNGISNPNFYNRTALRGLSFWYPMMEAKSRCRRCRTIFRYSAVGEPSTFNEGPWRDLSTCAEMLSETECKRWGLH